jgi:hypothetical protein
MTRCFSVKFKSLLILWLCVGTAFAKDVKRKAVPATDPDEPALTIDSWQPKPTPPPTPDPEEAAAPTASSPTATKPGSTAAAAKPAVTPPAPVRSQVPAPARAPSAVAIEAAASRPANLAFNEMSGTLASVDADAKTLRLTVEGGYNPQFDYDAKTLVLAGDHRLAVTDLQTGDKITVRYLGKDLTAREIVKTGKSPKK